MHRMMYGFAFIRAQRGPWEEKTEMTVLRVGSNLNTVKLCVYELSFVSCHAMPEMAFVLNRPSDLHKNSLENCFGMTSIDRCNAKLYPYVG